jgi:hypothetical protein
MRASLRCQFRTSAQKAGQACRIKQPQGLKSVRENACRPYGTRAFVPLHPALPCRAFISRRVAAGVLVVLAPPVAFNGSSHAVSKARSLRTLYAALKRRSSTFPRSAFPVPHSPFYIFPFYIFLYSTFRFRLSRSVSHSNDASADPHMAATIPDASARGRSGSGRRFRRESEIASARGRSARLQTIP